MSLPLPQAQLAASPLNGLLSSVMLHPLVNFADRGIVMRRDVVLRYTDRGDALQFLVYFGGSSYAVVPPTKRLADAMRLKHPLKRTSVGAMRYGLCVPEQLGNLAFRIFVNLAPKPDIPQGSAIMRAIVECKRIDILFANDLSQVYLLEDAA